VVDRSGDEVIAALHQRLEVQRQNPELWLQLGLTYQVMHRWDEAMRCFQNALILRPIFFDAMFHQATLFMISGRFEEAIHCYRRALKIRRRSLEGWANLGGAYLKLDRLREARDSLLQALSLAPGEPGILTNLGTVLHKLGRHDEALAHWREALAVAPDFPDAWLNLGHALQELDRLDEAEVAFERVLTLRPEGAEAMTGLGIIAHKRQHYSSALKWYQAALQLKPDLAAAHYNDGLTRLCLGDFAVGWSQYEWRWRTDAFPPHGFTQPLWDGQMASGKTLLLHCEQGFGDSIQFIRYAAMVKERCGAVAVFCPPALERLFSTVHGIDHLASRSDRLPVCDLQIPLMSLAGTLGTSLANVPDRIPYLAVDEGWVDRFRGRLAPLSGIKIGLAWRGNPKHINDRNRSIDPRLFLEEWLTLPGYQFIGLQQEMTGDERQWCSGYAQFHEFSDALGDFADTAGLISSLDGVISVDTAVVHLAGALGRPVWVLLPKVADWRWLRDRTDSPWYPTMRLLRQTGDGGWGAVISRVAQLLQEIGTPEQFQEKKCTQ